MADVQSNIHVNIDTSDALASLKLLQRQISAFHTQMSKSGAAASAVAANQAQNLMNSINATGQFQASMRTVATSTEHFTNALERNKLTSREYFRYTGAATKTFGRLFKSEFETINKVARERVKDIQTQYIKMGRGANGALQAIAVRPLTLDMKNLATQTAMAAQRQQLLNQLLKQGSTNLLNFGKNTQWAGRQLMVGFTVPLMLLGSTAAKTFMKLEEQAIRFKRVYGEMFTTAEETDAMVKQIQTLAKEYTKYGVAVEKTMEMAANAAAMGKMGAELTAQVAQATRLAVLGGVEQEQALETTISVTNAFGVAAEDLAKKIDFLNAVENQTVVSIEDLTIAIPKAGPVVQQLGGDVEDLAFFLTAMKEGGINASEGANALKSGLASLINPSEKASKMLAGLGINIKGIVEANQGDVAATVVGFAQALDTLDPLNRARAIEQLFGKFQFSRLSTLFQNVTAQGTQASRVLGLTKATTEELAILSQRELDKIENTTTYKFKKTIEDLKVSLAPVGEQFLKALTPIVEFVGKVLEKFNNLGDGSKKFVTMLTIALGAIGPVALMSFGLLMNGLANIIKLFASLKSAFNRTGASTQILGNQTDYLTKEQLEASAVAASLDQVHQRLRQTFTSETAAVNALALAYKNAIAAQIGFTGPVRGGGMKGPPQSKKYSTGVTSVPGSGNQDTVPAMLTPGEAVIPADAAQDPANKPIIARMVAGEKVPGFNKGTTKVTYNGKDYNAQSAVGAKNIRDFLNQLVQNPDGTLTDKKTGKIFTKERLTQVLDTRQLEGKFSETKIRRSLTRDNMSNRSALIKRLKEVYNEKNAKTLISEQEAIEKALKDRGLPPLTKEQKKNAFTTANAHLTKDVDEDGNKRWRVVNVAPDPGYINQFVNSVQGNLGKELLGLPDDVLEKYNIDREELRKIVDDGAHPKTDKAANTFRGAARYQIENQKRLGVPADRIYQAHLVDAGLEYRGKERIGAYSQGGLKSFADLYPKDKGVLVERVAESDPRQRFNQTDQQLLKKTADLAAKTESGKLPPTNFGKLIAPTTGFSFDVPGVGGLYDGPNGKVFVKPMMSELDALAEKKATDFARQVHGLDTPEQKISTMIDPSDPEGKRKIIVLESKYDARFDENKMPKTFSRDQYFRQLVASAIRGDKDLKMGNLGGNRLTDVGTAGVFDKATSVTKDGLRVLSDKMPSMYEMAERNLQGVPGSQAKNSPNWFANETQKKINQTNYTADQYDADMKKEIKRIQANAEKFVQKIPLNDPLRPAYLDILRRINEGANVRDWRPLFHKHRSIAIKPNEISVDEDGKATKPKTQRRRSNVKTAKPSDTRTTSKAQSGNIRNVTSIRGRADAETVINPRLTERAAEIKAEKEAKAKAMAEADAKKRYGTVAPTASQRSQRRQNDTRAAAGKPLLKLTKDMSAPVSAFSRVMEKATQNVQKSTVASKVLDKFNAKRNATAEKKAQAKAAGTAKPGVGMGGAAMGIAGIAMVGSMIPGSVGEMFQKLMMPLMGLSMILPMVNNKFGAIAVGIGAAIGAVVALRMAFDKAANAVLENGEKFRGSTSAINSLAKFGGKVTASEQMDLKRKNSFSMLGPATGKTTYGEAFVQTKEGKALTENLAKQNAEGKGSKATSDLSNQLTTAVMSGAMDINQAKSLAMNAAREAGDMSIGLKVIAQMETILGPNGEDLDKNPLEVRTRMVTENQKRMQSNMSNIENAGMITKLAGQKTMQKVGIGASAAGGAAIGATIGAALGTVVPVLGNAVGAIIGGGIGAAAGAIGGYFASKKFAVQSAQLGAAYAVDSKIALEQNKQMLDSMDMYYQKKIEELRLQGKINEALELEKKYLGDKEKGTVGERDKLTAAQAKIQEDIVSNYNAAGGMQESMMSGMKKAATARYKDNPNEIAYMDVVGAQAGELSKSGAIDKGQEFLIQAKMASGDIPPSVFRQLLQMATDNKEIAPKMMNIITKFSGATSESIGVAAQNILNAKGDIDKTVQTQFITKVEAFEKDSDALDFAKNMIKLNNLNAVIPSNVLIKYYTENDEAYQKLNKMLDAIEGEKNLTADIVYNIIPNIKGTGAFDEKYFDTLTEDQQKVYTTTIASIVNIPAPQIIASEDYQNWLKENTTIEGRQYGGAQYPKGTSQAALLAYYKEQQGFKAVTEGASITATAPASTPATGDKKGPDASPLDELLKKLRDVRKNTIKVTKGFDASFKSLNNIFGGKKTIEVFSGIENDMRRLGAGEDLIELIVGMDPDEFEKQKNKLFKFKNGEIVALKDGAKSIGDALQSIALGDFVSTQDRMVKNIGNQNGALERLQAAGVEGSLALEMVADASVAAAIANDKLSDKQLKKVIKAAKELTKVQKQKAAADAAIEKGASLADEAKAYNNLVKILGQFTQEQIEIIVNSQELLNLLAAGLTTDKLKKDFDDLLKKLEQDAIIKFKFKLLTIEGMQEIFDTGFSNAMESFDVKETALRLKFNIDNKALNDEIKKAEEKIALAQEEIRIQEIGLKEIEDQEEKVNEQYDKRLEALDQIEQANASVSQQQKGQLTLAEALTSGDIAAAARAAQEMRAQQAADNITKQKEALEQSREYELSQLRAEDGRSRIEIETKIKELQDQIYEIEQKSLEPNRETLRLNELALENAIEGLTTLGKTREQWEAIKNAVDLARISSAQFIKSMQDALNIQGSLIKAYQEQKVNTPPITPQQKVTCPEGYEFDGTNCVMKGATVIVCPAGFKQVGDKCVKEGTTEVICPDGHTLVGNNCVKEAEKKTICPDGYNLVGNDCVKEGPTKTICPDGYDLVGNDCIKQGNKVDDPIVGATTPVTTPSTTKYVVKPGDTLWDIAKDNDMTLAELYKLNPKFKTDPKYQGGNMIWSGTTVKLPGADATVGGGGGGGFFQVKAKGGLINPMRFAMGGFAKGTDTVPAMLSPGEFIMSKYAVDAHGIDTMKAINNGQSVGGSVYNNTYTLTVNAKTDANPNDIAQAVMATIKQVDDRRIRGVSLNGRR